MDCDIWLKTQLMYFESLSWTTHHLCPLHFRVAVFLWNTSPCALGNPHSTINKFYTHNTLQELSLYPPPHRNTTLASPQGHWSPCSLLARTWLFFPRVPFSSQEGCTWSQQSPSIPCQFHAIALLLSFKALLKLHGSLPSPFVDVIDPGPHQLQTLPTHRCINSHHCPETNC